MAMLRSVTKKTTLSPEPYVKVELIGRINQCRFFIKDCPSLFVEAIYNPRRCRCGGNSCGVSGQYQGEKGSENKDLKDEFWSEQFHDFYFQTIYRQHKVRFFKINVNVYSKFKIKKAINSKYSRYCLIILYSNCKKHLPRCIFHLSNSIHILFSLILSLIFNSKFHLKIFQQTQKSIQIPHMSNIITISPLFIFLYFELLKTLKQKCHQNLHTFTPLTMAYYLKDQLSINTRKLLADFMAQLIIIADSVQSFRLALAATPFFNGVQLFRFLDQDQKGYLTPKDFARLVSDDSKKLLHYAFGWFDVSKVGQITKTQFLQFVFPHSNPELRQLITARMLEQQLPEQKASSLPEQTDLLRCLILQIMQRETRLIPMRRILMDQEDYTIKAVMNCLDVEARGWVTTGDIYKFLKNYDVEVTMGKVCGIVGVYDCDMNGKINMREMQILVQGLENSQSQYRKIVRNSDKCAKTKMRNQRCSCYKKYGYKSAQKLRSTSMKKQMKIQTAKKTNKQNQQQKRRSEFADKIVSTKLGIQLKDEKDRKSQKNRHNIKVERQRQKKVDKQKSNKKQRIQKSDRKQKIQNKSLEELRLAFQALEKQTQFIDEDLKKIEEQMGARTEMEMQRQLESAHIKKRLKLQQQEMLRRKIEEMEIVREQERIRRIKEEETARIVQMENRRALQLQIQRNRALQRQNQNFRIAQEQRIRELEYQKLRLKQQQQMRNRELQHIRMMQREKNRLQELQFEKLQHIELQKIKEVESQRLATLELRKIKQIEASRLKELQIKRLSQIHMKRQIGQQLDKIKQIQIQNAIRRSRIQQQAYDREIIASYEAEAKKLSHSQYDWYAEAKIKALHEEEVRERLSMQGISQKESQYFWRYRNYCENLASIGDPLGIKQHLAQTDKYLIKSKSIRDQIKRDRTYSLNRYTNLYKSKTKSRTNTQNQELIAETPDQKHKDIIDTINKRTEQTKLAWSNN